MDAVAAHFLNDRAHIGGLPLAAHVVGAVGADSGFTLYQLAGVRRAYGEQLAAECVHPLHEGVREARVEARVEELGQPRVAEGQRQRLDIDVVGLPRLSRAVECRY